MPKSNIDSKDREYLRMIKKSDFDEKTKQEMLLNYCRMKIYIEMFIENRNETSDTE